MLSEMHIPRLGFCLPYMPLNRNPSQSVHLFPCKRDIDEGSAGDTVHIVILVAHPNLRLFDFHRRAAGWEEGKGQERNRRDMHERPELQTKTRHGLLTSPLRSPCDL